MRKVRLALAAHQRRAARDDPEQDAGDRALVAEVVRGGHVEVGVRGHLCGKLSGLGRIDAAATTWIIGPSKS